MIWWQSYQTEKWIPALLTLDAWCPENFFLLRERRCVIIPGSKGMPVTSEGSKVRETFQWHLASTPSWWQRILKSLFYQNSAYLQPFLGRPDPRHVRLHGRFACKASQHLVQSRWPPFGSNSSAWLDNNSDQIFPSDFIALGHGRDRVWPSVADKDPKTCLPSPSSKVNLLPHVFLEHPRNSPSIVRWI